MNRLTWMFSPVLALACATTWAMVTLPIADRRLIEQHELRVEAAELALDDLVEHVGRLAGVLHLGAVDRLFLLDRVGRHVLAAHPLGIGGGDVHRHFAHEVVEVVGARHEVRLAVHLDHHADPAAEVDVGADRALCRGAAGALGGLRQAALAEDGDRLLHVAVGLGEGRLALHHARAGLVAQLLDLFCRDCHRRLLRLEQAA